MSEPDEIIMVMQQDTCGPMVGRAMELARLLGLLDSVAGGEAAVALVSGDAGVGKTRLVTELVGRARERGFCVLAGRCAELGDSVPYLPLADALRSVTGEAAARVAELVADRPVLGRLLPDHGPGTPTGGDGWELARQQLFGAVLGLLTELAETNPVLLVLEDLHWADRSTRDLVTFLSRVLHRERVAVLGSYRTDDLHRRHPLRPVVAELLRLPHVTPVDLGPLDPASLAAHIATVAELSGRRGVLDATRADQDRGPGRGQRLLRRGAAGRVRGRRGAAGRPGRGPHDPGGAAVGRRPAGAARRRGQRPPGGRRAGHGRVGTVGSGVRGGHPRGGGPPVAGPRRPGRVHVPARAAQGGDLRRPAARRADQAARDAGQPAVR